MHQHHYRSNVQLLESGCEDLKQLLNSRIFDDKVTGHPYHALLTVYVDAADQAPLSARPLHPREQCRLMLVQRERGSHSPKHTQSCLRAILRGGGSQVRIKQGPGRVVTRKDFI